MPSRPAAAPGSARDPGPSAGSPGSPGSTDQPADHAHLPEVAERVGSALHAAGLARLPSRVLAALLAHEDGRMGAADLAAVLHVSPASISSAVGYLDRLSLIRRERERGSRRDSYVVKDDAWQDVMMQTGQVYAPIIAALGYAVEACGPRTRAGQRLQLSADFMEFIVAEMDGITQRWEERQRATTG